MFIPWQIFLKIFSSLFLLFIYCEYIVYYIVQHHCDWPKLDPKTIDPNITQSQQQSPVKVLILADTHLLGSRNGHWFDKLRREWQMYRAFQTAMTLHPPDLVFILGDLTDEGLYCSSTEFEYYVKRFYSVFSVPETTTLYVTAGNHDMGFHYGISPYLNQRFVSAFNAPSVQLITLRGNHFVLVNSMALEGDGCFLCRPAEQQITQIEKTLLCSQNKGNNCKDVNKLDQYSRPILLQHYPLFRTSDIDCTDSDSLAGGDSTVTGHYRERWDCLSHSATVTLMRQIRPRVALDGHTHHGCTRQLPLLDGDTVGIEYTLPSFSWRNKNNPTYGMAIFTPNNYAFRRCEMPKESTVINFYMFGGFCLFLWLLYSYLKMPRKRSLKLA